MVQFTSTSAATSFFNSGRSKFAACRSFNEPNPGDKSPGGGTYQVNTQSVSKLTVGGNHAFEATQTLAESEAPGMTLYINILFVVAGTNVYSLWDTAGTNDQPAPMGKLIHQIQSLYPHK